MATKDKTAPAETETPKNLPLSQRASAGAMAGVEAFSEFAGLGMENVGAADLLVPRLTILQTLSPQVKRNKAEFIDGAEVGDICDVGLGEILGDNREIFFLPVYYRKDYLEWFPRETGKGLANVHSDPAILDQTRLNDRKQAILPNGNLVAETAQFYGFIMEPGGEYRPAFIPMASTQLKKSRKWLTLADRQRIPGATYKPPLFWSVYKLGTVFEENPQGDWMGWTVNVEAPLPQFAPDNWQDVMEDCKKFVQSLRSGEARADLSGIDGNEGGSVIDGESEQI